MKTSQSQFSTIKDRHHREMILHVVKSLKKRNFGASYFSNADSLKRNILKIIPKTASIGIGGSVTIRELGLIEKLKARGNKVIHHWKKGLSKERDREIRIQEGRATYYLTSANAITMNGDIINIDGIGNRIAAMIYGPQNVIIIAGRNKIVSTIDDGIKRAREIAAVMNAKRVGAKTPCAKTGICIDCHAQQRICRVVSIMQYRPWQTNISVMLADQELGF